MEKKKEEKKEEEKIKETKKEEIKKEEDKNDLLEVPVKPQMAEKVGIKNLVDDSYLLSTEKTWDELGVKDNIKKGLIEMDFISPSKIQSTTFPLIMKEPRLNLVAQAKNGSGKTGAFGLGVISSIDENLDTFEDIINLPQNLKNIIF